MKKTSSHTVTKSTGGSAQKERLKACSRRRARERQDAKIMAEQRAAAVGAINQLIMMAATPWYLHMHARKHAVSMGTRAHDTRRNR